ncbi:MAG: hypothetical protein OEZ44_06370 [Candidatus Bathyarchaeota archaeon]|nr:hypothetical protein [Candidatus Bathyarchaeota archaeon]
MNRLYVLYAIMRAGYLNKVRTYRFLIILALTIVAGYVFVPPPDADYVTLAWVSATTLYRGVYNSAWIGAMVALLTGAFLTLLGFYVVNDSVKRDEETRVGQIIATTPLSNSVYTLGNALCNFAVLSTMVAIVLLTALGMQYVRGEDLAIDLWALMAPFLVLVMPLMFLVAAIAVLFETRPMLRGGAGNIVYAFVWLFGLPLFSELFDMFGIFGILSSMGAAGKAVYPELDQNKSILGLEWGFTQDRTLAPFTWHGFNWTPDVLQTRLVLVGVAVGISLLASVRFSRFDPSRESKKIPEAPPSDVLYVEEVIESMVFPLKEVQLRPLGAKALQFRFGTMLLAECRLILKELKQLPFLGIWGSAASGALIIAGLLIPLEEARGILLPVAWLLPVLIWSKLGTREARHRTDQLIFSSANSLTRQLPALWLSGVLLAIVTGSGVALNLALHGDWLGVLAWVVGALFIPSLALCLGVWTGSSKLFELTYTLLWYIGPLNRVELLDFMGALPGSVEAGIWKFYLAITIILFGLAFIGRKWQIQKG